MQWKHIYAASRAIALSLCLLATSPLSGADISYVYDNLGRVLAVIDPASDTAIYAYDAVGNLTGITRQTSSTLAIFQFTPSGGPVGTAVTIYGTGFSATPASNTVKFNGTTATVATASTTVLTTTVPASATNGTISVTVAGTTATSSTSFTVGTGGAPTLSNFSPAVAGYGATLTLTGTNYDTTVINNRVAFAAAIGAAATATTTSITVPVPASAQTGPISVSTTQGKATSAQEFFVAPPGVVATDIQYTGRITVNGSTVAASITTANKNGLMVFDGVAGQRIDLGFSSVTIGIFYVTVYRPDGVLLTLLTTSFNASGGGLELPILPLTGTYTLFLDPYSTYTGNATVTVSTEVAGTITPGGAAVPISITRVGQNARYTFNGTAGQTVSIGMTSVTMTNANVSILKPDGTTLVIKSGVYTTDAIDTHVLPVTGTYAVLIDPQLTTTGGMTITLYDQPDVTGSITIDGTTVPLTLTVPGQRARYTFTGTTGQWVTLGLSSVTITSSTVSVLKPDGTQLTYNTIGTAGGSVDPTIALPATGTYTIVVDPASTHVGAITLTLSSALTGSITLDGSSVSMSLTRVGQTARYTFTGTTGQQVNLGLTSVTISNASVSLIHPNGNTLVTTSVTTAGGSLDPSVLSTTGTYTILVDPSGIATGSITLTLSTELTGSVTIGGGPVTVSLSRAGQNARYAFAGTSGQQTTVRITSHTIPGCTSVFEYKPDGAWITYGSACSATLNLATQTLPTTGTYQVFINPSGVNTGTLNLEVTNP